MDELFEIQPDQEQATRRLRVVHTADWHLGKTLGDLSREDEHERFLNFLLQTLAAERADLLIVAGDVFDAANPPQSALRLYYNFLSELRRTTRCQVLVIAGNHDSPTGLDAPKHLLEAMKITVVGSAPEHAADSVFLFPNKRQPALAVAALPFLRDRDLRRGGGGGAQSATSIRRALVAGIAQRYSGAAAALEQRAPGAAALATGHLTVQGAATSESERAIHIGGLGSVTPDVFPERFQYVALGHLHRPQSCGDERIRYAGSPIALSFSEADDEKELRVLDFVAGKLVANRGIPIPRWRTLVQLPCKRDGIESAVSAFHPEPADLPAWVELVIDEPLLGEDAVAQAAEAARGREFEIVRVIAGRSPIAALRSQEETIEDAQGTDDLLSDPARVFELRLEAEDSLELDQREALRLAFQNLLEKHQQRDEL